MANEDVTSSGSTRSGMGIKYRYAADEAGCVIDIRSPDVARGKDYVCLSCTNTLRPVLGEKRQKHFRHKHDVNCSPETYLHNLAKLTFYNTYRSCLETGIPYVFEYPVQRQCTYCGLGPCAISDVSTQTDLTNYFPEIYLEKRDGKFIPDLLLVGKGRLYVEMVVTHYLEDKKRDSGVRIVEISVSGEEDIEMIRSGTVSLYDARVCAFNLQIKPLFGNFEENCDRHGTFFHLDIHGAARLITARLAELPAWRVRWDHFEEVENLLTTTYLSKLTQALQAGKEIRHCWLCVYLNLHTSACNRLEISVSEYWPTGAVDCEFFKRWSAELIPAVLGQVLESLEGKKAKCEPVDRDLTVPHPADWNGKCIFCGKITMDWYVFDSKTGTCKCNSCLRAGAT